MKEANRYCLWEEKEYARITIVLQHPHTAEIHIEMRPYKKTDGFYDKNLPFPSEDVRLVKVNHDDYYLQ